MLAGAADAGGAMRPMHSGLPGYCLVTFTAPPTQIVGPQHQRTPTVQVKARPESTDFGLATQGSGPIRSEPGQEPTIVT